MTTPSPFAAYTGRLLEFISTPPPEPSRTDAEFVLLARELFSLQFEHVSPFRRFCLARDLTPDNLADWRHIPALPAAAFKEFEATSISPADRGMVFHSSGTTRRQPGRHFHNAASLAVYEASLLAWFQPHLLPKSGDAAGPPRRFLCQSLTPPPAAAPHSSLAHMIATVIHAFGAPGSNFSGRVDAGGAWEIDFAQAGQSLDRAAASGQPVLLLGTAFNLVHLLEARAARRTPLLLPAGSRVMETGGYKGRSRELPKAELHRLITGQLGVPADHIVCEYGMSELCSQAYDGVAGQLDPARRRFQFPPWARALVVSPETGREVADGEIGLLQLFDLANVRSVLAIQTEDLAVRRAGAFGLLGRAGAAESRGCSLLAA